MRRLAFAAVGLALVVSAIVGGVVGSRFGASASPDPPNPGHDWSAVGLPEGTWPGLDADRVDGLHVADLTPLMSETFIVHEWHSGWPVSSPYSIAAYVLLDTADYPDGYQVQLELAVSTLVDNVRHCVRLRDEVDEAVPGTLVCSHIDPCPGGCPKVEGAVLRSEPFSVPPGEHLYTLEGYVADGGGAFTVHWARIAARATAKPSTPPTG